MDNIKMNNSSIFEFNSLKRPAYMTHEPLVKIKNSLIKKITLEF